MIIDLDSHLREGYFMDEAYKMEGPWAKYTPIRTGEGQHARARFTNIPDPTDPKAKMAFTHSYMYDRDVHWRGGDMAERQRGGWDMEWRLKDIAKEGIDFQLLFPSGATGITMPGTSPGGLGAALCHSYNNWASKLVQGHEDRLSPVAMIPAGSPDDMPGELRRCVKELGMKASHLVPYAGSRNLDDPVFFPFYEEAQNLDVALLCHPHTLGDLTNRFNDFFPMHVLGRPLNCVAALVALVCGGVFERFPKLRVAFFECSAEWIVYWMHRMDDDFVWVKEDRAKHLTMLPSEYVKRHCWVTCEADEKMLPMALDELGADHVCMATDYPHFDSVFPNTVKNIRQRDDITEEQKSSILGESAQALLKL